MDISNQLSGHWLAAAAVFLLAGTVKGVIGLGLPTVAMALLALWMPPAQAAALLIVPSLVTNIWQTGPRATFKPVLRRIGGMQAGIVAGTLGGALWLGVPGGAWASVALGVALVAYALWGLTGRQLHVPPGRERWLGPAVGAATGLVTAVTGVFAMPAVPYMQALGFQRDALIQAMGLVFMSAMLSLASCLAWTGHFEIASAGASTVALLPVFAGMYAGQAIRVRLHADAYRKWFFIGLVALGAYSVLRAALLLTR